MDSLSSMESCRIIKTVHYKTIYNVVEIALKYWINTVIDVIFHDKMYIHRGIYIYIYQFHQDNVLDYSTKTNIKYSFVFRHFVFSLTYYALWPSYLFIERSL